MSRMIRFALSCIAFAIVALPPTAQSGRSFGTVQVWFKDCNEALTLTNETGFPVGAFWIAIQADDQLDPPEIGRITVHDPLGGRTWDVDDDEDEDNDDAGEADDVDATPLGEATGWHRVQARADGDVFAPGEHFTLSLCDENGGTLQFRSVLLVASAKAVGAVGGDGGRLIIADSEVPLGPGTSTLTIHDHGAPPVGTLDFSFSMLNNSATALTDVVVVAPQTGPDVVDVSSGGLGTYDSPSGLYTFPTPLQPLTIAHLDLSLDQLDASGTTVIELSHTPLVSVPALGTSALVVLLGGALFVGCALLRRR